MHILIIMHAYSIIYNAKYGHQAFSFYTEIYICAVYTLEY